MYPVDLVAEPSNWRDFARTWLREQGMSGQFAMLVAGPSTQHPEASHSIEIMRVGDQGQRARRRSRGPVRNCRGEGCLR
jgi:hypothetical protein